MDGEREGGRKEIEGKGKKMSDVEERREEKAPKLGRTHLPLNRSMDPIRVPGTHFHALLCPELHS